MNAQRRRLRAPAYAKELRAYRRAGATINLHAHVGRSAWKRAQGHVGARLVVVLDYEHAPDCYDFSDCAGLIVALNAVDADLVFARRIAVRMCEHGARLVVVVHPKLPQWLEFVYSEPRR